MASADQNTIQFDLVSPERRLMSEAVASVTCPGEEGDFGVLPGHAPYVIGLRPGVLKVNLNGDEKAIFIAGGFADVSAEQVTVLAEEAVAIADIDTAALDNSIAELSEDIKLAGSDADRAMLENRLSVLQLKRQAAA